MVKDVHEKDERRSNKRKRTTKGNDPTIPRKRRKEKQKQKQPKVDHGPALLKWCSVVYWTLEKMCCGVRKKGWPIMLI